MEGPAQEEHGAFSRDLRIDREKKPGFPSPMDIRSGIGTLSPGSLRRRGLGMGMRRRPRKCSSGKLLRVGDLVGRKA